MVERRKHQRKEHNVPMVYSLFVLENKDVRKVLSGADGVDISDEGLGMKTEFPLEPGHILRLRVDNGSEQTAMVRWVEKNGGKYRVGILFY